MLRDSEGWGKVPRELWKPNECCMSRVMHVQAMHQGFLNSQRQILTLASVKKKAEFIERLCESLWHPAEDQRTRQGKQ